MKNNNLFLLLAMFMAVAVPAQIIKNFEIEGGVSANIPQKRTMSTELTYSNAKEVYNTKNPITFGYYGTLSYKIKLGFGFSVVPGISFMAFSKESKTEVESFNASGASTSKEIRNIKNKYDNLAPSVGLRWSFSKVSLEAGLAYMFTLKQDKTTTVEYQGTNNATVTLQNYNKVKIPGFVYSYYQFGFKLVPFVWLNAGLRVILNGGDLMNNDYSAYYNKSEIARHELVPTLGIKIRL